MKIDTTKEIAFLNEFKKLKDRKAEVLIELENKMTKKYPAMTEIYVDEVTITIETKHHILRRSAHMTSSFAALPSFVCEVKESPRNMSIDEFVEIKKIVDDDYEQCLNAVLYLQDRYDIRSLR